MATAMLIPHQIDTIENKKTTPSIDASKKTQDLITIKDWLKQQPHLPDQWDDSCLLGFLRNCHFSIEKTKEKLDMYFSMRTACPEFLSNREVTRPGLMDLARKVQYATAPGLTDGKRVTYVRGFDSKLDVANLMDAFKLVTAILDVRLRDEPEELTGDVFVVDGSLLTTNNITKLSPNMVKKYLICIQEAYPLKLKEVHVVNVSPLIDFLLTVAKPFLKEKIKKRIIFHKNYSDLLEYIPKNMVPPEHGGTGHSLAEGHENTLQMLKDNVNWIKAQDSIKTNEALRPGKPQNYDELFGIDGSFRQLSFD